jgi:hypothetical protein
MPWTNSVKPFTKKPPPRRNRKPKAGPHLTGNLRRQHLPKRVKVFNNSEIEPNLRAAQFPRFKFARRSDVKPAIVKAPKVLMAEPEGFGTSVSKGSLANPAL